MDKKSKTPEQKRIEEQLIRNVRRIHFQQWSGRVARMVARKRHGR